MPTQPSKALETFANPHPDRDYLIEMQMPEFTCLCPKTGQPDFATLSLDYVPDAHCVELKALKLYIWSFRNEGHFHEDVTNRILNDLVAATAPRRMRLKADFFVRGGIATQVTVEYRKPGWVARDDGAGARGNDARGPAKEPAVPKSELTPNPPPAAPTRATTRFRLLDRSPEQAAAEAQRQQASHGGRASPHPPPAPGNRPASTAQLYLGIDVGTSGCRIVAMNDHRAVVAQSEAPIPLPIRRGHEVEQAPVVWWNAVESALADLLSRIPATSVAGISVSGTSGTLLIADGNGEPLCPALLYNDARARAEAEHLAKILPRESGGHGATSSLAKLLWLKNNGKLSTSSRALHPADWLAGRLTGLFDASDYHNVLKMGYDVLNLTWPAELEGLGITAFLPARVLAPGQPSGGISDRTAKRFGFLPGTQVFAGTTDSIAAFLASGAGEVGNGVTALGSTLVLKLLSDRPVFAPEYGVYSHRLGERWLVGGASNTGGAVLLQYFKAEQMARMTPALDPDTPTGLDYYPLIEAGERFPVNDPALPPRLEPLPASSGLYFQGMLEGIARIERDGYALLNRLGAASLNCVRTTGGGAHNPAWSRIRARLLKVPMVEATSRDAACGAALLAMGQPGVGQPGVGQPSVAVQRKVASFSSSDKARR